MKQFKVVNKQDIQHIGPGKLVFISDLGGIRWNSDFYMHSYISEKSRVPALTVPPSDYHPNRVFSALYADDHNTPYFFNIHKNQLDGYGIGWVLEMAE